MTLFKQILCKLIFLQRVVNEDSPKILIFMTLKPQRPFYLLKKIQPKNYRHPHKRTKKGLPSGR